MTAWHVDEHGNTWQPFKVFTCPNHPDGPPRLPAEGYEREELTAWDAYEADEILDLFVVVNIARRSPGARAAAGRVERLLGFCCLGHDWQPAGYRKMTRSDLTLAKVSDFLLAMTPLLVGSGPSILLAELAGDVKIEPQKGTPLPVRIPLTDGQ